MGDIRQYEPLWGSWTIDATLGEGSFGKVYRVKREEFGRTYYSAVKIISIPQSADEITHMKSEGLDDASVKSYFQSLVSDIIQEIDLMNALKGNSNIVGFEDYKVIERSGDFGWDILIRMELLTSLTKRTEDGPLSKDETIKLGINICRALELCNRKNIIHRDIKPENILISEYGEYKLGDFGIARQAERTMSGMSKKGTYTYMAPEVYKGEKYGASADIYSLGIVLYRLLNKNRAPFLPDFPAAVTPADRDRALERRMSGETLPPINGVSPELNEIVLRACSYGRSGRYAAASEFLGALERLIGATPQYRPATANEYTEATEGVFAAHQKYEGIELTSKTEGVFAEPPQYSAREHTSMADGVWYEPAPTLRTTRTAAATQQRRPADDAPEKKIPFGLIAGVALVVVAMLFVPKLFNKKPPVNDTPTPPVAEATNTPNVATDTLVVTDNGAKAENSTEPTTEPAQETATQPTKVLLSDLTYFSTGKGGDEFSFRDTLTDNLGETRYNCLTGLNSAADLTYKIDGKYEYMTGTLFQTLKERNSSGAILTVYGDGNRLLSETMHKGIEPLDFSVNLAGVSELRVVYESEPNEHWAAFRNAAISDLYLYPTVDGASVNTVPDKQTAKNVLLKDLTYFTSENGDSGRLSDVGTKIDNLGNIQYNCLTGHDEAAVLLYKINGQYSRLTCTLFQYENPDYSVEGAALKIIGDGNTLYAGTINVGTEPINIDISLAGVNELVIDYRSTPGSHWASFRGFAIADCTLYP